MSFPSGIVYCKRLRTFEVEFFELRVFESETSKSVFMVSLAIFVVLLVLGSKVDSSSSYIDEYVMLIITLNKDSNNELLNFLELVIYSKCFGI